MANYYAIEDVEGGVAYVELADVQPDCNEATKTNVFGGKVRNTLSDAVGVATYALKELKKLSADEVEVEFGVKLGGTVGTGVFWVLTKAETEASIKITAKWKKNSDDRE